MEHLYTSPKNPAVQNLNHLLNKEGLLIIQTPMQSLLRKG
jgi:hypothetical protein